MTGKERFVKKRIYGEEKESTFEKIYEIVRQIPPGKVATYGQIAALAGNRRWSRVVGYALHVNPDPDGIPCFRVVNRYGEVSKAFAFGGGNRQIALGELSEYATESRGDLQEYQGAVGVDALGHLARGADEVRRIDRRRRR